MRTLHKRSLMPAAIGATAIAWIARALSGRLVADRGDRSDSGDYMRTSLKWTRYRLLGLRWSAYIVGVTEPKKRILADHNDKSYPKTFSDTEAYFL